MPPEQPQEIIDQLIDLGEKMPVRVHRSQREQRLEAALRQVEQIAVSSQSWRDGKEELDKIKWICREALEQP